MPKSPSANATLSRRIAAIPVILLLVIPHHFLGQGIDRSPDGIVLGPSGTLFGSFGQSVDMKGDFTGDGFDDLLVADIRGNPPADRTFGPGIVYLIPGSASGLDERNSFNDPSIHEFLLNSPAGNVSNVGIVVRGVGDINNDGIDDFFIGVNGHRVDFPPLSDNNTNDYPIGSGFVIYGVNGGSFSSSNLRTLTANGAGGFEILGRDLFGRLGRSAAGVGDINGDGIDDMIVSAPRAGQQTFRDSGETYVIFGKSGGYSDSFSFGTISGSGLSVGNLDGSNGFVITSNEDDEEVGRSVAGIGDFNGDGYADIALSASETFQFTSNGNATKVGATYIVFGSPSGHGGEFKLSDLNGSNGFAIYNTFLNNSISGTGSSQFVDGVGDLNGDGFDDFGIALTNEPGRIIYGTNEILPDQMDILDMPPGRAGTVGFNLTAFAGTGDINGDGLDDFLTSNGSSANIVYSNTCSGFVSRRIERPDEADRSFGKAISGGGDFNGDGIADFVVGSTNSEGDQGAVSLLLGEDLWTAYGTWIDGFFPGVTDPAIIGLCSDPNSDGVDNALAYAMDLDPRVDPGMVYSSSIENESLVVTYRQHTEAVDTVSLYFEVTTNFEFWFGGLSDGELGVSFQVETDYYAPGTDRVRISVPLDFFDQVFEQPGLPIFARPRAFVLW
jgi:hypothetical protein